MQKSNLEEKVKNSANIEENTITYMEDKQEKVTDNYNDDINQLNTSKNTRKKI